MSLRYDVDISPLFTEPVPDPGEVDTDLYPARNGAHWRQVIEGYLSHIGHVQIADAPGRHQPGTGAIDFTGLFAAPEGSGYSGSVGLEYRPQRCTEESLSWLAREARAGGGAGA
jgi:hydroxypyruvate isomerase